MEAPQGLVLLPQGPVGQPLVVEEVRGLVVVIADHLRLPGTSGGLAEVRLRLGLVPQAPPGHAQIVVGLVVRHVGQLALAQAFRVGEAALQQLHRLGRGVFLQSLAGQVDKRPAVLGAGLALAPLPGVEAPSQQPCQGLVIAARTVQQGDFPQGQIVPLGHQLRAGFQRGQPLGGGHSQPGGELVILQQKPRLARLQGQGPLHGLLGPGTVLGLVVAVDGQVPPGHGQAGLFLHRGLPVGGGLLVALLVVEQAAQVVVGHGRLGQRFHRLLQKAQLLQAVGEAVVRAAPLALLEGGGPFHLPA